MQWRISNRQLEWTHDHFLPGIRQKLCCRDSFALFNKTKVLYRHLSQVSDTCRNGRETMMLRDLSFEVCKPFLCTVTTFVTLMSAPSLTLAQQPSAAPQSANPQAQSQVMTTTTTEQEPAQKMPPEQLDSLVAPIALFPDPLLATALAASTYPLEIIQLQQWMERNKNLKDKALADAVAKQPWDPSVQSLAVTPDVVQRLAGNIQWTTDLGNAFLAQQSDVMEAVQRMRAKAQGTGNLKTSAQQTVETKTEGGKQVIVVEPAQNDVVYVPSYDSTVVYGPPPPAYPYYPYTYPGYYPGMGLAWGAAGFALGAWAGGAWGNCNWGNGDININNNNNFNRNNINNINRGNINRGQAGGGKWQHNPQHRGNAPYGDRGTAGKFGGRGPGGAGGGCWWCWKTGRCRWRRWCWRCRKTWRCRWRWKTRRCRWRWWRSWCRETGRRRWRWKTWRCRWRWETGWCRWGWETGWRWISRTSRRRRSEYPTGDPSERSE